MNNNKIYEMEKWLELIVITCCFVGLFGLGKQKTTNQKGFWKILGHFEPLKQIFLANLSHLLKFSDEVFVKKEFFKNYQAKRGFKNPL